MTQGHNSLGKGLALNFKLREGLVFGEQKNTGLSTRETSLIPPVTGTFKTWAIPFVQHYTHLLDETLHIKYFEFIESH